MIYIVITVIQTESSMILDKSCSIYLSDSSVFFYTLFYIHQIKYNNCGNTRDNEQFEISQENNLSEDNEIEGKNIE